jgi:hypothetical protein
MLRLSAQPGDHRIRLEPAGASQQLRERHTRIHPHHGAPPASISRRRIQLRGYARGGAASHWRRGQIPEPRPRRRRSYRPWADREPPRSRSAARRWAPCRQTGPRTDRRGSRLCRPCAPCRSCRPRRSPAPAPCRAVPSSPVTAWSTCAHPGPHAGIDHPLPDTATASRCSREISGSTPPLANTA